MYEKLPFDKGETIIGRESGVFKRIKNEEDAAIIRQYMQQNKMKWNLLLAVMCKPAGKE